MLGQLIKHEFRATRRAVPFVYLITLAMAGVNYLTVRLGIQWLFTLTMVFLILLAVSEVIVTYVLVISRFYKNLYSNEGYLMHTLPVRPRDLLVSKVVISVAWMAASYLVLLGVFLVVIAAAAAQNHQTLSGLYDSIIQGSGITHIVSVPLAAFLIALYGLLSICYVLAQVFFSIAFGSTARFHKQGVAGPIVTFLVVYFAMQMLALAFIVIVPLGVEFVQGTSGQLTGLHLVGEGMLRMLLQPPKTGGVIGLGSVVLMVLGSIGLFFATGRIMAKQTSLR